MPEIKLTKKQYLELLKSTDATAMAQEAVNEAEGKDLAQQEYQLRDYLLSFAPQFGLLPADFTRKEHDWTDDLFDESFDIIDDYAEMEMWEKLAFNLAMLEIDRKYDSSLEKDQRMIKIWEAENKYTDEFIESGLENVSIKNITG